jgi:hypothetical protein
LRSWTNLPDPFVPPPPSSLCSALPNVAFPLAKTSRRRLAVCNGSRRPHPVHSGTGHRGQQEGEGRRGGQPCCCQAIAVDCIGLCGCSCSLCVKPQHHQPVSRAGGGEGQWYVHAATRVCGCCAEAGEEWLVVRRWLLRLLPRRLQMRQGGG